jgi:glycyl-tRNA synthetase beta chain
VQVRRRYPDMYNELLLEIFSEEIPSRFQSKAIENSKRIFTKILNNYKANFGNVKTYISSRRLTIVVECLTKPTEDLIEERRGPKVSASESAVNGFLSTNGKTVGDLIEKNGYFYLTVERSATDIRSLIPCIITEFIELMPWPKSMRWYIEDQKKLSVPWVRPIRSVLCIYNHIPMNVFIEEIGLTTCDYTYGHRFLSPNPVTVLDFEDYSEKLKDKYVVIDFEKKMSFIRDELVQMAADMGLCLSMDQTLLEEIAGLVEYPFIHIGAIDEKFMKLPQAVLSTSMRVNQKYFTLIYPDSTIAPFFGTVTNVPCTPTIRSGLERVLRARLSDAMFFYKEDTDATLEAFTQRLSSIVFHERLGSVAQKVDRMMSIANTKEEHRAISLCKADLSTQMVGEFPELQGVIGEIYARVQDEDDEVATAIREHYKPIGSNDRLPETHTGSRISFFDKLDTLIGFIGVGISPSGSKDPFALRRAALSIIRMQCERDILDGETMSWYIETLISSYSDQGVVLEHGTMKNVQEFMIGRLKVYMSDRLMMDTSIVEAVISSFGSLDFDYKGAVSKAETLDDFSKCDGFQTIRNAFRRANGIIGDEQIVHVPLSGLKFAEPRMEYLLDHVRKLETPPPQEPLEIFELSVGASEAVLDACEHVLINDSNPEVRCKNLSLLQLFCKLIIDNIGVIS